MSRAIAGKVAEQGWRSIAINNTFRIAPEADMLYAADEDWWRHARNRDAYEFKGVRATCSGHPDIPLRLRVSGHLGFDPEPDAIRTGGNSGFQAIQIAMKLGASRVLLFGFDMKGGHWHGTHVVGLREAPPEHYARWAPRFETLVEPAKELGVSIVNCTPGSAITAFPFSTLEEEIRNA